VLNLRAAGERRFLHTLGTMSVHKSAEPLRLCFPTNGVELFLRQGWRAAVTDALRREDLDEVGALRFPLSDYGAQGVRRQTRIADRLERREDARTRCRSDGDEVAQVLVLQGSWALDRGHARHQRRERVPRHRQHRLYGCIAIVRCMESPGPVEVPSEVRVAIDQSGEHRVATQVVGSGIRPRRHLDATYHTTVDDDRRILHHAPAPIEQVAGTDRHCLAGQRQRNREHREHHQRSHVEDGKTVRGIQRVVDRAISFVSQARTV